MQQIAIVMILSTFTAADIFNENENEFKTLQTKLGKYL